MDLKDPLGNLGMMWLVPQVRLALKAPEATLVKKALLDLKANMVLKALQVLKVPKVTQVLKVLRDLKDLKVFLDLPAIKVTKVHLARMVIPVEMVSLV